MIIISPPTPQYFGLLSIISLLIRVMIALIREIESNSSNDNTIKQPLIIIAINNNSYE